MSVKLLSPRDKSDSLFVVNVCTSYSQVKNIVTIVLRDFV